MTSPCQEQGGKGSSFPSLQPTLQSVPLNSKFRTKSLWLCAASCSSPLEPRLSPAATDSQAKNRPPAPPGNVSEPPSAKKPYPSAGTEHMAFLEATSQLTSLSHCQFSCALAIGTTKRILMDILAQGSPHQLLYLSEKVISISC